MLVLYGALILLMSSWRSVMSDRADFNSSNILWSCYFRSILLCCDNNKKLKPPSILTLNLLRTTIVAPPSNASKWQMGFNSAFKGLKNVNIPVATYQTHCRQNTVTLSWNFPSTQISRKYCFLSFPWGVAFNPYPTEPWRLHELILT